MRELALEAAELARVRAEGEGLLAAHTGRDVEEVRADTERVRRQRSERPCAACVAGE